MDFLMLNKVLTVGKGFTTLNATVWLLCSMNGLVPNQMGGAAEALDACGTLVGPVTCVDPLVFVKVSVPRKGFPTLTALKGPLSTMHSLVDLQC